MIFKKHIKSILPACIFFVFSSHAWAGIVIGGSRLVHTEGEKQTSFSVKNDDTEGSYLIQSWVESLDGTRTPDFITTPPIYLSPPGSENILRIIPVDPSQGLKKERLYYLNVKAIPAVDRKKSLQTNSVIIATTLKIKLFIRPAGLKTPRLKAENRLTFTRQGRGLYISNPTPYWLTLSSLQVGNVRLSGAMVPPQGGQRVDLPAGGKNGTRVSWVAINDTGSTVRGESPIRHD